MVIDILNDTSVPVATAAVRDILNTLSVIDYFNVISANGLFRAGELLLEYSEHYIRVTYRTCCCNNC